MDWTFEAAKSNSKSRNTPFDGWQFRGGVAATIVGGKIVYRRQPLAKGLTSVV
jgi:dihydroorotase